MRFDTALFDLDGTLLNTLTDLWRSVNMMLERHGYPARSQQEIRASLGFGAKKLVQRALSAGTDDAAVEQCLAEYRPIYAAHMNDNTQPYEGVLPMLHALKDMGVKMAVISNKPDAPTVSLCGEFFAGLLECALGDRPDVRRKPDTEGVMLLLGKMGSKPESTIYIGDSEVDVQTAKNAGFTSVAVTWGFRTREDLQKENPDHIIDHPDELTKIIQG